MIDAVLELSVGASVHRQVLREYVDGLVAGAAQAVGQNVPRVTVGCPIVVQGARVVLRARGRVGSLCGIGEVLAKCGSGVHD